MTAAVEEGYQRGGVAVPFAMPGAMPCAVLCRYAKSDRLRQLVNLVVVGGVIDPEDTGDREERAECEKMHNLIKEYKLQVGG